MLQVRGVFHGIVNEQRHLSQMLNAVRNTESSANSFGAMSAQAVSKARRKITPEAYQLLSRHVVKAFYADDDIQLWHSAQGSWRILAVDGTTIQLPKSDECVAAFGVVAPSSFPLGRLSVFYDVRNRFVLETILSSYEDDERSLAMRHLEVLELEGTNRSWRNLLLADMNYPCFYLMHAVIQRGDDFLFRYAAKGASCITKYQKLLRTG